MSDIVERLRNWPEDEFEKYVDAQQAADEIERLREHNKELIWQDSEHIKMVEADNAKMRAALEWTRQFAEENALAELYNHTVSALAPAAAPGPTEEEWAEVEKRNNSKT